MATLTEVKTSAAESNALRSGRLSLALRRDIVGYLFVSPFILGFLFWFLIPAAVALYLAFHKWNLMSPPEYVGFQNIEFLFKDPLLGLSLKATITYTLASVPIGLLVSFCLALLLNIRVPGIGIFRTIYYLPSIVPAVANAVMWTWILNTEFGLMNVLLRGVGMEKTRWLQEPTMALTSLMIITLWSVGGSMIIFLAGLQGIPDQYYEAAEIDGAGRFAKLVHITLPLMSPIIFFNLIIGVINSFQVFTSAFLITNGGPQNSTLFLVLYIYRSGFQSFDMGYAATLSWLLFFILMLLSLLVFRFFGRRVFYENPGTA
jgi:multiple sugar transport system permease protein